MGNIPQPPPITAEDDLYCGPGAPVIVVNPTPVEVTIDLEGLADQIATALAELALGDINVDVNAAPVLEDACIDGCEAGKVCFMHTNTGELLILGYVDSRGVLVKGSVLPDNVTLGVCTLKERCVQMLTPGPVEENGKQYFTCWKGDFTVQMAGTEVKSWTVNGGLNEVADPTKDLTEGVDYILAPCNTTVAGMLPETQWLTAPIDESADPLVDGVLTGTGTWEHVCSICIEALTPPDCEDPTAPVVVTMTNEDGESYVQYVWPGSPRTICASGDDVTVVAPNGAIVSGTIANEVPITQEEC